MNNPDSAGFEAYRPLLLSIAYRMLGSATEAEDMVQDAYVRYQGTEPETITAPKAYLSKIVTRLCLDHLQSAQVQRETYLGPWLPEPVLTESGEWFAPAQQAELHDSLSIAFLTLLEDLTPLERAVFLLHDVFDYQYAEIAEMVGREEAACRQLCSRAKKHLAEHRPRFKPSQEAHRQMLNQFIQATSTGELEGLMQLLSEDVVLSTDGGGKARGAALHPVYGREAVAKFVLASPRLLMTSFQIELAEVNDEPALMIRDGSSVRAVITIAVDGDQVSEIRVMGNPDKLKWVNGNHPDNDNGAAKS
ncbi:MAG: RNA polymerase sigma-70 factor [Chloroflexota bacterium]